MTTAFCITADAAYFLPALYTIASIRQQPDGQDLMIFLISGRGEAPPDAAALVAQTGTNVTLLTVDLDAATAQAPVAGFSRAVYRRLFLDQVLPEKFTRIVSLDADIEVVRPGLATLQDVDMRGYAIAGAVDMIFLKDFGSGALAAQFHQHRINLGLSPEMPYFNNGVVVIDRAAWRAQRIGERALRFVLDHPATCPYLEQDGLNAVLRGAFAPLSPRFNFMGDFFHLDLEAVIAPVIRHFVTRPKPWETAIWKGRRDLPDAYGAFFDALGQWPEPATPPTVYPPETDVDWRQFRHRLLEWAEGQSFVDSSPGVPAAG